MARETNRVPQGRVLLIRYPLGKHGHLATAQLIRHRLGLQSVEMCDQQPAARARSPQNAVQAPPREFVVEATAEM
jgi:hypothetical protein